LIAAGLLAGYKFGIEKIKTNPGTTANIKIGRASCRERV
jgi:hypothetical protein